MSMIGFPLLLIPFAIYNIFVFLMPGVAFTSQVASVTLLSRVQWTVTFGDALLALSIVLLLFEIIKASRPGARYLTDHLLSLLVFAAAAAEFLLLTPFGTSAFFLLTVLSAVEFVAGVVLGLRNRSHDSTTTVPAPVRQEPDLSEQTIVESKTPESPRAITPAESKPPEMITVSPAPVTLKPESTPTTEQTGAPPAADSKVADWNASDLIAGRETPPKP